MAWWPLAAVQPPILLMQSALLPQSSMPPGAPSIKPLVGVQASQHLALVEGAAGMEWRAGGGRGAWGVRGATEEGKTKSRSEKRQRVITYITCSQHLAAPRASQPLHASKASTKTSNENDSSA